jgi:hypothetical protein
MRRVVYTKFDIYVFMTWWTIIPRIVCSVWDLYTSENIYSLEKIQRRAARYVCNRRHNTSSITDMMHTLSWSTLQERILKARLQMFHKIVNDKIEIPYENILIKSQSKTRYTHNQTFRQIQCNKDSYNFSFFCRTIKDWNQLPKNITNNATTDAFKESLSHELLLKTFPYLQ